MEYFFVEAVEVTFVADIEHLLLYMLLLQPLQRPLLQLRYVGRRLVVIVPLGWPVPAVGARTPGT